MVQTEMYQLKLADLNQNREITEQKEWYTNLFIFIKSIFYVKKCPIFLYHIKYIN